jgi:hypothetical protein
MKRLILLLLVAGCAPKPEDFTEACRLEQEARSIPPAVAAVLNESQLRSYVQTNIEVCAEFRVTDALRERNRRWAPAVAIVFGAASDALATHNFYVYRVPEARRYLSR